MASQATCADFAIRRSHARTENLWCLRPAPLARLGYRAMNELVLAEGEGFEPPSAVAPLVSSQVPSPIGVALQYEPVDVKIVVASTVFLRRHRQPDGLRGQSWAAMPPAVPIRTPDNPGRASCR